MKIQLLLFVLLISKFAWAQTPLHSFESHLQSNAQGFTEAQIDTFISKANFENYRLLDSRVTLSFDNGFEIILLSANEVLHSGLISNASSYPAVFPDQFRLPVFHMAPQGWIGAAYTSENNKSKGR